MKSICWIALLTLCLANQAFSQQAARTELKRADLTGTNMEIVVARVELPVGAVSAKHLHYGEEIVFVLEGGLIQMPGGSPTARETGSVELNVREVPHAGYKVVGDKPVKIITVHIVDKGKPMTVPVK
jgi:quercetin dioxygenase-like cupin family protein